MSAYGTVTCLAPAGHHPPKPSRQTRSFMKKPPPSVTLRQADQRSTRSRGDCTGSFKLLARSWTIMARATTKLARATASGSPISYIALEHTKHSS